MYVPPEARNAICDSCTEGDCSLDLAGLTESVAVVNLDRLNNITRNSGERADCAILWNEKQIFAIVELKGGQTDVTIDKVVRQLQGSVNKLDSLIFDQHVHDFYPILMYKGRDPTRSLGGKLIKFRGIPRRIIPRKCGEKLSSIPVR